MRIPYEQHYRSLTALGGAQNCWQLPFAPNAIITKLVIVQVGGTPRPFLASVFNSRRACSGDSSSSGGNDPLGLYSADPALYRIHAEPLQGDANGRLVEFFDGRIVVFRNMDGQPPAIRERFIYIEMTPDAGDDTSYDVAIAGYLPGVSE